MSVFDYKMPTDEQSVRINIIRDAYNNMIDVIESTIKPGRQRSVALTELETSGMWAIRGIVKEEE